MTGRNGVWPSFALGAGVTVTLVLIWLLFGAFQSFLQPLPAIQTQSAPKTIVVVPSPDAALVTAVARIERNTAALPTLAAAYAIAQTATSSDNLKTWAAARQTADATAIAPSGPTCLACLRGAAK